MYLWSTDRILSQGNSCTLTVLGSPCGNVSQQVSQHLLPATDFHSRHADGESCASFLFPFLDELEEPRDSTGCHTQALCRAVPADHGEAFACEVKKNWLLLMRDVTKHSNDVGWPEIKFILFTQCEEDNTILWFNCPYMIKVKNYRK